MLHDFRLYIWLVFKEWLFTRSCVLAAPALLMLLSYFMPSKCVEWISQQIWFSVETRRKFSIGIAVLGLFYATFAAWRTQYLLSPV